MTLFLWYVIIEWYLAPEKVNIHFLEENIVFPVKNLHVLKFLNKKNVSNCQKSMKQTFSESSSQFFLNINRTNTIFVKTYEMHKNRRKMCLIFSVFFLFCVPLIKIKFNLMWYIYWHFSLFLFVIIRLDRNDNVENRTKLYFVFFVRKTDVEDTKICFLKDYKKRKGFF